MRKSLSKEISFGFLKNLNHWYVVTQRKLPWRKNPQPYSVWISEIMLQQTQVKTVVPYFNRFLLKFPNVKTLASAKLENVLAHWSGLGYYKRAIQLHQCAKIISKDPMGFPHTREKLESLPGIGPYTAGAILSIAWNQAEPILESNVKRVLTRLVGYFQDSQTKLRRSEKSERFAFITHTKLQNQLWSLATDIVRRGFAHGFEPRNINQSLMELGALLCTPQNPQCAICPVNEYCISFLNGSITKILRAPQKPKTVQLQEQVFVILKRVSIKKSFVYYTTLQKNLDSIWRKQLWDFPKTLHEISSDFPQKVELQDLLQPRAKYLGALKSTYFVTRHKVKRTSQIWVLENANFSLPSKDFRWFPIQIGALPMAMGAPTKKTFYLIQSFLGVREPVLKYSKL